MKDAGRSEVKRKAGVFRAWILIVGLVLLITLPTAILYGLGDLLFSGKGDALKTFIAFLVLGIIALAISVLWEIMKDRKSGRKK